MMVGFAFGQQWYEEGPGGWAVSSSGDGVVLNGLAAYGTSHSSTVKLSDSDGNVIGDTGDFLGLFTQVEVLDELNEVIGYDDELRGIVGPADYGIGYVVFPLLAYGDADEAGDVFTYKFFDESDGLTYDIDTPTLTFEADGISGGFFDEVLITVTLGAAPSQCTDESACNTGEVADCVFPNQYYDCDGNCTEFNNWYVDNDSDGLGAGDATNLCADQTVAGSVTNSDDLDDNCASNLSQNWYVDADGDGLGAGDATPVCTDTVSVPGSVLNNADLNDDCASNLYQDWYVDLDGDGLGAFASGVTENVCTDNTVDGSVTNNDDLNDDCFSNEYQDWYVDSDGDGLGAGDATNLCTDTTEVAGSVTNNSDLEPDCATNNTDDCGVCAGSNACVGCVDPNATNTNLEYLVNETALDCNADSYTSLEDANLDCCVYTSFSFNQSMNQAAYFFSGIKIDGDSVESGDVEIYAFNNEVCVGGGVWNGSTVEVMLMGYDGTGYTTGYLETGDIPTFKIIDSSDGSQYDAVLNGIEGAFGDCATGGYPGNLVSDLDDDGVNMSTSECVTFPAFANLRNIFLLRSFFS